MVGEASRFGRASQAGVLRSRREAVSLNALPQGPVVGIGPLERGDPHPAGRRIRHRAGDGRRRAPDVDRPEGDGRARGCRGPQVPVPGRSGGKLDGCAGGRRADARDHGTGLIVPLFRFRAGFRRSLDPQCRTFRSGRGGNANRISSPASRSRRPPRAVSPRRMDRTSSETEGNSDASP